MVELENPMDEDEVVVAVDEDRLPNVAPFPCTKTG
jgi:hypothetical protein